MSEFLELTEYFITPYRDKIVTVRPPGVMQHARWMSRAKIFLLREQYFIPPEEEDALADVFSFITKLYVRE